MQAVDIPTVTSEGLLAFHAKHFPNVEAPAFSAPPVDEVEEDDGLGWYPDGVKRLLDDEAIAYFRNAEIQRLLCDRRLGTVHSPVASPELNRESPPKPQPEQSRVHKKRRRKNKPQHRRQQLHSQDTNNPKWEEYIHQDSADNPNRLTHRRLARELDEQKLEPAELSYDD